MDKFSHPGLLWFIAFATVFVTAGIVNQVAFWREIEPVLRSLGHRYDLLSLRRYQNGFWATLFEYKRFQIAENRPLTWWWAYWFSLWTTVITWLGWVILVFGTSP